MFNAQPTGTVISRRKREGEGGGGGGRREWGMRKTKLGGDCAVTGGLAQEAEEAWRCLWSCPDQTEWDTATLAGHLGISGPSLLRMCLLHSCCAWIGGGGGGGGRERERSFKGVVFLGWLSV